MKRGSRRTELAALALASLTMVAGCQDTLESIFVAFLLLGFAALGTVTSFVGIGFAIAAMLARRRGSALNLGFAIPFATLSIFVIYLARTTPARHPPDPALLACAGVPLLWLVVAIVGFAMPPSTAVPG